MLKKIFQPKVLAIITIVSMAINVFISIVNNTIIGGGWAFVINLLGNIINGHTYIIIYLLIILFAKTKNIRKLNLVMIVQLSIALIFVILGNSIRANVVFELNNILNIVPYGILLIMAIGIHFRKETFYKPLMILSIIVLMIQLLFVGRLFIIGTFASPTILYVGNNMFYNIISLLIKTIGNIGLCSFIIFMYQYGKSISQRSGKNE